MKYISNIYGILGFIFFCLTPSNSFVKVYNNHNIKNEQKKKEEINNSIGIKDLKFECPEEMHFFMVNLTHNCIYANSNF